MWTGNMSKKKINPQLDPYAVDKFATISANFKVWFLKFWLAGAAFYLAIMGIPSVNFDTLDRIVIMVLILTLAFEYIGFTVIIWMSKKGQDTLKHLPHHIDRKKMGSLLATGLYVVIITVLVLFTLELWVGILRFPTIGTLLNDIDADPFTFGLLFILFDYLWMLIRKVFKK